MREKLDLDEMRKKSYKELSKDFGIKLYQADFLKSAINPDYYPIITDHNRSLEEMANDTGLCKNTIIGYRSVLIGVGLDSPRNEIGKESIDKVLFFLINNPSTYEEICKGTKKTASQVSDIISNLRRKDKIRTVAIELGRRDCSDNFSTHDLVDGITGKSIAYKPGDERLLGQKLTEYLPKKLSRYERKSLSQRLKHFLPKEAFNSVHDYMNGHH